MRILITPILFLIFISCQSDRKIETLEKVEKVKPVEVQSEVVKAPDNTVDGKKDRALPKSHENEVVQEKDKFKHGHIETFYPGIFKGQSLTIIDSSFHAKVISQIDGYGFPYSDKPKNYYISNQNDFNGLTAMTVSLYWGACYEGLVLLLLDKDSTLLNHINLTEWYSSCDISTDTQTQFLNDSTFSQEIRTTEPGFKNYITELTYKAKVNKSGQVDTLEIIHRKEYEE